MYRLAVLTKNYDCLHPFTRIVNYLGKSNIVLPNVKSAIMHDISRLKNQDGHIDKKWT